MTTSETTPAIPDCVRTSHISAMRLRLIETGLFIIRMKISSIEFVVHVSSHVFRTLSPSAPTPVLPTPLPYTTILKGLIMHRIISVLHTIFASDRRAF